MHKEVNFDFIKNEKARHCIERMLDKNPDTRVTVDELLKTEWVTNNGLEIIDVAIIDKKYNEDNKLINMDR
jgi:hypothetical protein